MKVHYGNKVSVSFKKSAKQTSIAHNNRDLDYEQKQNQWHKHINHDDSHLNRTLVKKDIKEMYEEIFGDAVQEYNAKQKRNDRKIKNYYSKVLKDKKLEPQREFILQIGDKNDFENGKIENLSEISNQLLEKYVENFEERNPNLKIYNAVIHNDEASPHLHLNVIPVATGYKRGVQVQPSFDKALKQQEVEFDRNDSRSLMKNFRDREVGQLEQMLQEYKISRKEVGTNFIKDHHEYKEMKRGLEELEEEFDGLSEELDSLKTEKGSLENEVEQLTSQRKMLVNETKFVQVETVKQFNVPNVPKEKYAVITRADFQKFQKQNELVPKLIKQNDNLEFENIDLTHTVKKQEKKINEQEDTIYDLENMMDMARKRLDKFVQNGAELWNRVITYTSKFYPEGSKTLSGDMTNDPAGEQDYEQWRQAKRTHDMGMDLER